MKCPECSSEMEKGMAYIRGTALGFLFVGFSLQHCWFKSQDSGRERIVVHNKSGFLTRKTAETVKPNAWYCEDCETTIVVGRLA